LSHRLHRCWLAPLLRAPSTRRYVAIVSRFSSLDQLVRRASAPTYALVSRPSQPPCDTRHEGAPAAQARRGFRFQRFPPPARCWHWGYWVMSWPPVLRAQC
jgi:hypothetical protein